MSPNKIQLVALGLGAAVMGALSIASASWSSATSVESTPPSPVNRWVESAGPCPLVIPGTRPSEGDGWAIGPVEVTKGARFTAYVPKSCDDAAINAWAYGAWQIAPDLVIYRVSPWDETGGVVAPLTKEEVFGEQRP